MKQPSESERLKDKSCLDQGGWTNRAFTEG